MRRFRVPRKSALTERSLRELYRRLSSYLSKTGETNLYSVLNQAQEAMRIFFLRLGKPQFRSRKFHEDDPLDPEYFEHLTDTIKSDVQVGYEETEALRNMGISSYNYGQVRLAELKRRAEEVSGLVTDLRLLSGQQDGEVLVFSDRFKDSSKVDAGFSTENTPCDVLVGYGALTLGRTGTFNVPSQDIIIEAKPVSPSGITKTPTRDNTQRFYEGHFYDYLGTAEPEGGSFHIVETIDPETLRGPNGPITQAAFEVPTPTGKVAKDGTRRFTAKDLRNFVVPGGFKAQFLERIQSGLFSDLTGKKLAAKVGKALKRLTRLDLKRTNSYLYLLAHPNEGQLPSSDIPIGPENLVPVDQGASEEELQEQRHKMVDGDPTSYWQCELAIKTDVLQDYLDTQPLEDEKVASLPAETRVHLSGKLGQKKISPDDLRQLAASAAVDTQDFEIELTFTFATQQTLNWITLSPMNFDSGAWLEVTDVSTAPDHESTFVPVESFIDHSSPNILTDGVNEEVSQGESVYTLAPNRFSFRGLGVWPFAARQVKIVRVRLRQRTPTPAPYERFAIQTTRSLSSVRRRNA
jgi:hypothetical protein